MDPLIASAAMKTGVAAKKGEASEDIIANKSADPTFGGV